MRGSLYASLKADGLINSLSAGVSQTMETMLFHRHGAPNKQRINKYRYGRETHFRHNRAYYNQRQSIPCIN